LSVVPAWVRKSKLNGLLILLSGVKFEESRILVRSIVSFRD
jgi:hypothetical protein